MHTGTKYPYMHILFINLYFTTAEPQFQEDNTTTSKDINYEKLLWSSWGQAIAFPDFFETRITFPGCRALLLFYFLTPTANAESWAVEAFSLCMFLSSTKLSEWSPMERRAPAQGSSRDQRI